MIAPCLTDKGIALQDVYLGPAGVLTGSAQLAQEAHEEAEEQQQRYEIAQLVRLDDLVQDYLSLVRVNQMQLQPQDLGVYIQSWGTEMQVRAATQGITLQLEGVESLGQVVFHASTLRRVVFNLVQNALDATPNGGTVSLAGQGTATQVQLQVRDTGSGIPAERLERIFEPLYTTKPGGTGLGLYIVQEIVTAHGGQITVQSIEGQGTTFRITLPRVPAEAPVPAGFPDPRITLGRSEYGMGEQDTDGPGHYPRMRQSTPARRRRGHQEGGWHVGRRPIHTIRG